MIAASSPFPRARWLPSASVLAMKTESFDFSRASTSELFGTYASVLAELRRREIIRTSNAPAGDYAEYLIARALGGTLQPNSNKSFDVEAKGRQIQVKCRVVDATGRNPRQALSPFRTFAFDEAAVVLFNPDYTVAHAVMVPVAVVKRLSVHRPYVNGYVAMIQTLLAHPQAKDITTLVQKAAR